MERVSKTNYYLDIAQTVAERSTCLRRHFGAIIVKDDSIVSTGYNGAPRGRENCSDIGHCYREALGIPRGERYELCRSVHAEANAIIAASYQQTQGATLYLACTDPKTGKIQPSTNSCSMCKRFIINSGIKKVIVRETKDTFSEYDVEKWVIDDDSISGKFGY
ncbi:MAG: dCMP deaminase family protein [Clostridia bacterium]|nr:dCMP deaminase family protein [Clostridia bacterium]